jgi:hypothetical protein
MVKLIPWLILGVLSAGLFSCRSTRKIQNVIARLDTAALTKARLEELRADSLRFMEESFLRVQQNQIPFETFSAKVKVDFEGKDGKKADFNAFVRLRKDSLLWVSINVALGIEAFRLLITPDSVKVLNKLDKVFQLRSVAALQEVTKLPFTFRELQNVLIGNPVFWDSPIVSYESNGQSLSFYTSSEVFKHLLTVNKTDFTLQNSKLDDLDRSRARTCLIIYDDYQNNTQRSFSAFRKITVSEKSKVDIQLEYKQYAFNEALSFPFSIPKNYHQQ